MLDGSSGPPRCSGFVWSIWKPGQAPAVRPVDGQGCVAQNARGAAGLRRMRTAVLNWCFPKTDADLNGVGGDVSPEVHTWVPADPEAIVD